MGATGVAPLTIISHTIDIVKHYGQMIVNAEREIFFTTNVWEASEASEKIAKAIRELSKKVVDRGGDKIVIKLSASIRDLYSDPQCTIEASCRRRAAPTRSSTQAYIPPRM